MAIDAKNCFLRDMEQMLEDKVALLPEFRWMDQRRDRRTDPAPDLGGGNHEKAF